MQVTIHLPDDLCSAVQALAGDRRDHYESGIEFSGLTAPQQTALAAALDTLRAAAPVPDQDTR